MKVKKFEGKTEQDAMQQVKDELGLSAIVLSIKRKPYRGILGFFKQPIVVVTAAYEEKTSQEKLLEAKLALQQKVPESQLDDVPRLSGMGHEVNTAELLAAAQSALAAQSAAASLAAAQSLEIEQSPITESSSSPTVAEKLAQAVAAAQSAMAADNDEPNDFYQGEDVLKDVQIADQQQRILSLENKLNATEELLSKVVAQLNVAEQMAQSTSSRQYDNNMIQLFYDSLVEQGVAKDIAEKLLESVDAIEDRDNIDINLMVKVIYNKIVSVLGEPRIIEADPDREDIQIVAFMGPTGVGKTTTVAKLSSILALNHNVRVGLVTADTYRIAAVEQLKTYADILGLDIQIVYNPDEIENSLDMLRPTHDVILIDTAGRSHRNAESLSELKSLLDTMPDSRRYLVLSVTTKYEDLVNIVNAYSAVSDFDLIFTKLDETASLGSILNICYMTGKKASYVTFGQGVPDDIEIILPDKIAGALLGLGLSAGQPYEDRRGGLL